MPNSQTNPESVLVRDTGYHIERRKLMPNSQTNPELYRRERGIS